MSMADQDSVCCCFGVDKGQIKTAIADGAKTVEEIGEKTSAGTGCGACIPQIEEVLNEEN